MCGIGAISFPETQYLKQQASDASLMIQKKKIPPYKLLIWTIFYTRLRVIKMKKRKKARRLLLDQHRSGQPLPVLVVTEVIRAADQHFRQIMPIEVTRFYLRPFFLIITFCLQKALDLKVSFCALQCLNSPRLLRKSTQRVQRDHFHCVAFFFSPLYLKTLHFKENTNWGITMVEFLPSLQPLF